MGLVPPREIFEALDGSRLHVSGRDWTVEVYGVFDEAERRWVQLSLCGAGHRVVTLRLAPDQAPHHAVVSLSAWLSDPTATDVELHHVS